MNAAEASRALTVLLVDDHAVVREGYRRLLERQGNIAVVAEAATADEAEHLFLQHAPSVVVMDIALPGISGIEALRRLRRHAPDARVIMFSMYDEAIYADRCLRAGACGYVTKASAPNVLVEAVHAVAEGRRYLSPDIAQSLALRQGFKNDPLSALSAREFEVLRRLVDGQTVKDIAEQLELNAKTVANLQSILRQKLGAENALQLVRQGELLLRGARGDAIE